MKNNLLLPLGIGAAVVFALSGKKSSASKNSAGSSSGPIIFTCSSVTIKDQFNAYSYFVDIVQSYKQTIANYKEVSYVKLVGDALKKLNKTCSDKYVAQKLDKTSTLLIIYLFEEWIKPTFISAYFGDVSILEGEELMKYDEFINNYSVAQTDELKKFIGYDESWSNDLFNIIEIIKQNGKYPVEKVVI